MNEVQERLPWKEGQHGLEGQTGEVSGGPRMRIQQEANNQFQANRSTGDDYGQVRLYVNIAHGGKLKHLQTC